MSSSAAVLPDNSTPAPLAVDSSTAARMIGVAPGTLNNWRTRGLGPTYVRHGLPGSRIVAGPGQAALSFTDPATSHPPARFYRVRVEAQP